MFSPLYSPLSYHIVRRSILRRPYLEKKRSLSFVKSFWKWTSQERPSWKESAKEAVIIFSVFGLAGTSSTLLIRPTLKYVLGIDGPFLDSPVSYTLSSLLIASPMYAGVVFTIGTLAGRHIFFANMARKVVGRFLPKAAKEKIACPVFVANQKKGP
jgi:hypothetical protein